MVPFIVADVGNIVGGLFTQWMIRGSFAIPKVRKLAVTLFGLTMAAALVSAPLVISGPRSALAVLSVAGFGWAAYSANTLAFPADVFPQHGLSTGIAKAPMRACKLRWFARSNLKGRAGWRVVRQRGPALSLAERFRVAVPETATRSIRSGGRHRDGTATSPRVAKMRGNEKSRCVLSVDRWPA